MDGDSERQEGFLTDLNGVDRESDRQCALCYKFIGLPQQNICEWFQKSVLLATCPKPLSSKYNQASNNYSDLIHFVIPTIPNQSWRF